MPLQGPPGSVFCVGKFSFETHSDHGKGVEGISEGRQAFRRCTVDRYLETYFKLPIISVQSWR